MYTIAIIGLGPRGLHALEQLLLRLEKNQIGAKILLFDPTPWPGAGPVWSSEQPDTNWINSPEQSLTEMATRPALNFDNIEIPAFPSYLEQAEADPDSNDYIFPPRNKIGQYLQQRFSSIIDPLQQSPLLEYVQASIIDIKPLQSELQLTSKEQGTFTANEALLCVGHQPTKLSEQLQNWKEQIAFNNSLHLFTGPYPISQYEKLRTKVNPQIGIRGFGLAMLDVLRALSINLAGKFRQTEATTLGCEFVQTTNPGLKIYTYALDNKPPAPKPINKSIDDRFAPTSEEMQQLNEVLSKPPVNNRAKPSVDFVLNPVITICCRVFSEMQTKDRSLEEVKTVLEQWTTDENYKHPLILDTSLAVTEQIEAFIEMAAGNRQSSLDYCFGQVWRHCWPSLSARLSHAGLSGDSMHKLIKFDERIKRYSFGPPVDSMQQVLALVKAGILNLDFLDNPELELTDEGWKISKNGASVVVDTLINSVLDEPVLLEVVSPLFNNLRERKLVAAVHSELGVITDHTTGLVNPYQANSPVKIALPGSMAKGSEMGVDSISQAFGSKIEAWADVAVRRAQD